MTGRGVGPKRFGRARFAGRRPDPPDGPNDDKAGQAQTGQGQEGRAPAETPDEEAGRRDAQEKGQRPAQLGQGQGPAAPLVGNEVAQVGQDGGVDDVLADRHEDERGGEGGQAGPDESDEGPGREQAEAERQAEPAAPAVGQRRDAGDRRPPTRTGPKGPATWSPGRRPRPGRRPAGTDRRAGRRCSRPSGRRRRTRARPDASARTGPCSRASDDGRFLLAEAQLHGQDLVGREDPGREDRPSRRRRRACRPARRRSCPSCRGRGSAAPGTGARRGWPG